VGQGPGKGGFWANKWINRRGGVGGQHGGKIVFRRTKISVMEREGEELARPLKNIKTLVPRRWE